MGITNLLTNSIINLEGKYPHQVGVFYGISVAFLQSCMGILMKSLKTYPFFLI